MRKVTIALTCLFSGLIFSSYGQEIYHFQDSTQYKIRRAFRHDTIVIAIDTAFLLNKRTFQNQEKIRNAYYLLRDVSRSYDSIVALQERRINQQKTEYDMLHVRFDSLSNHSIQVIDLTAGKLQVLGDTLGFVKTNLVETKDLLKETKDLYNQDIRRANRSKIWFGVGGFAVGIVSASLLILLLGH